MSVSTRSVASEAASPPATGFVQGLGLFDRVMIVAGAMIGSGIFIVPAAMAREIGSSGGLPLAWVFAGALTIAAPRVGLREHVYVAFPFLKWGGGTLKGLP